MTPALQRNIKDATKSSSVDLFKATTTPKQWTRFLIPKCYRQTHGKLIMRCRIHTCKVKLEQHGLSAMSHLDAGVGNKRRQGLQHVA